MITIEYLDYFGSWNSKEVIAYIRNDQEWEKPPSQSYLTAIHIMLIEQYGSKFDIPIMGVKDGELFHDSTWKFPGIDNLGIEAFVVLVNS